jgi:hypothetical protein
MLLEALVGLTVLCEVRGVGAALESGDGQTFYVKHRAC